VELKSVRIQNFRSVEDSGEFSVEHLTCLVGKNEAGKTAILQAIAGLNPHPATPFSYELERDYPKRYLARYEERHGEKQAEVPHRLGAHRGRERRGSRRAWSEVGDREHDHRVSNLRGERHQLESAN
jgi:recombinational DNA repair ATPase RecF